MKMSFFVEIDGSGLPLGTAVQPVKPQGLSVNVTDAIVRGYAGSGREEVQPRYYVQKGGGNLPVGNVTTVKPSVPHYDITDAVKRGAVTNQQLLDENVLYAVVVVGHSISADMSGAAGRPSGFSNIAYGNNKKVQWNSTITEMEVVDCTLTSGLDRLAQRVIDPGISVGANNPAVLLANEIAKRVNEATGKNIQFIAISGAVNGSIMYNDNGQAVNNPPLGKGGVAFNLLQQGLETANDYAVSIGKTLRVAFVLQISGEGEALVWGGLGMTAEKLKRNYVRYHHDLRGMFKEVTGDSFEPKIYRHQQHMNFGSDIDNFRNKLAQFEFRDPMAPIVFPMTAIDNAAGYEHPGPTGTFKFTGIAANNIFRDSYQKLFREFRPKSFAVTGFDIVIRFDVPVKPIRIDTSRGGTPVEQTFNVYDAQGDEIPVTNVVVTGDDELTITCVASPIGGTIYYKRTRPYLAGDPWHRNQADITDSDPAMFCGIRTPSYLLSFKQLL